jgi:phage tail sheath protein FI
VRLAFRLTAGSPPKGWACGRGFTQVIHDGGGLTTRWGRTRVTADSGWKYISVRRLFLFVEESTDLETRWVVFEPNDEPLRAHQ